MNRADKYGKDYGRWLRLFGKHWAKDMNDERAAIKADRDMEVWLKDKGATDGMET